VVEKGTVLAKIDPTTYEAALDQAEAALLKSQADLLQLEAKSEQAEQERKRAESLRADKAIADTDYDSAVANFKSAKANVAVGKASIRQNEAALRMAKTNLGYTIIKSPVRGVIIDRRVNVGQTVVASLNAPSLFLIAKDLWRMQVWSSVNEADIGRIQVDMPVRFTVDAYPDQTFIGKVTQIRMNATMTQNVVTYTVVVTTDNSSGKLLPYLTASVRFEVDRRTNVLLVPNAALRWNPQESQIAAATDAYDATPPSGADGKAAPPSTPLPDDDQTAGTANHQEMGRLWTLTNGDFVRPVDVVVGPSDGAMTEVSGGDVKEGMQVVVSEESRDAAESGDAAEGEKTRNPFLPPKFPKGSRPPPPPM